MISFLLQTRRSSRHTAVGLRQCSNRWLAITSEKTQERNGRLCASALTKLGILWVGGAISKFTVAPPLYRYFSFPPHPTSSDSREKSVPLPEMLFLSEVADDVGQGSSTHPVGSLWAVQKQLLARSISLSD